MTAAHEGPPARADWLIASGTFVGRLRRLPNDAIASFLLVGFVVPRMTLAEATREAARRRPFLLGALRAGVVNYTAAARFLSEEVGGDPESVATALRRFAESLPDHETDDRRARVSMRSGLGEVDGVVEARDASDDGENVDVADPLLVVGDTALAPDTGSLTGVVATGDVDAAALVHALGRLDAAEVAVRAAGVADETLVVAVERRDGPDAVRIVEDALDAVPTR